jgi:hypothetical protein
VQAADPHPPFCSEVMPTKLGSSFQLVWDEICDTCNSGILPYIYSSTTGALLVIVIDKHYAYTLYNLSYSKMFFVFSQMKKKNNLKNLLMLLVQIILNE